MSISVLNDQIQNIDLAVAREMAQKQQHLTQHHANMKVNNCSINLLLLLLLKFVFCYIDFENGK